MMGNFNQAPANGNTASGGEDYFNGTFTMAPQ